MDGSDNFFLNPKPIMLNINKVAARARQKSFLRPAFLNVGLANNRPVQGLLGKSGGLSK